MKSICAPALFLALAAFNLSAADYKPQRSGFDFPIYTNQPSGNMLENDPVRRAASSPALAPEETRKLIQVPPGFEVRLFAAEPMVVNPVAMTWDERGRLWVVELYEYPKGAPKGEKGRDRIKILEDTDADGVADKVTVFADGFSLATGIALGNGGVYLGAGARSSFSPGHRRRRQGRQNTTVLRPASAWRIATNCSTALPGDRTAGST